MRTRRAGAVTSSYRVHEAANADEAVAVLNTPELTVDLVFSDVEMPQGSLDGLGLARWIRSNHPAIKVILTSGAARSADIAGDLCENGPLMRKPYRAQHVVDRIKQLLANAERGSGVSKEPNAVALRIGR